jgi:phosphatidylserine decarboxylase
MWTGVSSSKYPPDSFANFSIQTFMEMAPLNLLSRNIGDLASWTFIPPPIHHKAIKTIAWIYGIDLSEYPEVESFPTSQDFFCRRFKDISKSRPVAQDSLLVSPCDAEILQCGEVSSDKLIVQVKGHNYPIEGLFRSSLPIEKQQNSAEDDKKKRLYFVFHLRPGDYHRFHSPRDFTVDKTIYIPGCLYPTTHTAMKWLPNLILSNERIVSIGKSSSTDSDSSSSLFTGMAAVGATCVGKITLTFDERIVTNLPEPPETSVTRNYGAAAPTIKKGEEFGYFRWGSCLVLVADVNLEKNEILAVKPGDEVRVGQRLI